MPLAPLLTRAAAAMAVTATLASPAFTQVEPIDLSGRTVHLYLGSSPGGYTDFSARVLARHLPRHLPGEPAVVVQNISGGGGLAMLRHFLAIDPEEEIAVAVISSTLPLRARAGIVDSAEFDPREVQWVGGFTETANTCMVNSGIDLESLDDLRDREITVGAPGRGSGSYVQYAMLIRGLGLRMKPILGYEGAAAIALAVERGELDGVCVSRSSMDSTFAGLIADGRIRPILYVAPYPITDLAGIPYLFDLKMSDDERAFLLAAHNSTAFGRPLAMLPDADPRLVAAMRDALAASVEDEGFIAELAASGGYVRLTRGPEIAAAAGSLYSMPDDLVAEIADMYYGTD